MYKGIHDEGTFHSGDRVLCSNSKLDIDIGEWTSFKVGSIVCVCVCVWGGGGGGGQVVWVLDS